MSFYDEVEKLFNIEQVQAEFNITIIGMKIVIINGYKKIISFSDNEIVLKLKDGSIVLIKGIKMVIKQLAKAEMAIDGELLSIERTGG